MIAVPSFRLLFVQLEVPKPDLTVKVTGKQWFWSYSYPDSGNFEFHSLMVQEKDLKPGAMVALAIRVRGEARGHTASKPTTRRESRATGGRLPPGKTTPCKVGLP